MSKMLKNHSVLVLAVAVLLVPAVAFAGDWPCYRGPNKNSMTSEGIDRWPPVEIWRTNVDAGYSQTAVSDGRVYTAGYASGQDTVYCFDENSSGPTPTELWSESYSCPYVTYPGPRATPTIDGNELYMFSQKGLLSVYNKVDGTPLWSASLEDSDPAAWGRDGSNNGKWGFGSSVLIEGDLAIVNASGEGVAFSKTTHDMVWPSASTGWAGHSSPVAFTRGTQRTVVIFAGLEVVGVDPADGSRLWWYPWGGGGLHIVHAADPIIYNDKVWISSGYGEGCAVIPLGSGDLSGTEDWMNYNIRNRENCSILWNDHVYGVDEGGYLKCVEFATGIQKWSSPSVEGIYRESAITMANGELVIVTGRDGMTTGNGDLIVVEATTSGYNELHRQNAIIGSGEKTWSAPVIANGKLYIRSSGGTLVCFDVSASGPDTTPPTVSVASIVIDGSATDTELDPPIVTVAGTSLGQVATFSQEVILTGSPITVTAQDTVNTTTITLDVTVP